MKKFIAVLLIFCFILTLASCKDKQEDDDKALETANTVYNVTGNAGSITIDEDVARTLLGVFEPETLGLANTIDEYELKLSATRIFNTDACMVEAFSGESEKPEGIFAICGQDCYVYSSKHDKYLLLTPGGAVEVKENEASNQPVSENTTQGFTYDVNNNNRLQEAFGDYSAEKLGLTKELSEYVLVVPGTTTTAADGKTVYVIRLYEKTGTATNLTLAFNADGNYVFDVEAGKYQKI